MNTINQSNLKSRTAECLLKLNAVKLQPNNPFTWASGWKSPIYCDNRIILSNVNYRNQIANDFAKLIKINYNNVDVIAGVATGAIGIGILVADKLNIPFIYVRPEPKKHGRKNQIEGKISKGQKVVVIEDLISTGKSSLNAIKALKENKLNVLGMLAIFSYEFKISKINFEKNLITVDSLSNYTELISKAVQMGYINKKDVETLEKWNKSPEDWS